MRALPALLTAAALGAALLTAVPSTGAPDGSHEDPFGVFRGGIAMTGNTLGVSKATGTQALGNRDSIGQFLAADGTTTDWADNESTAVLDLPAGSYVIRADLVWGGSYEYGDQDVAADIGDAIHVGFGAGAPVSVSPDPLRGLQLDEVDAETTTVRFYTQRADVTELVRTSGAGTYRVGGVPATNAAAVNSLNAAGWTLGVVYSHPDAPPRYLALDSEHFGWIDSDSVAETTYDFFCTPDSGTPTAKIFASAIEGDASSVGDQLLAGPEGGTLTALDGPGNPANNFFASQLNGADGLLDTRGSGGGADHDAASGVNTVGGRQGWDVTTVSPSPSQLAAGQDSLVVRAATTGDSYLPLMIGTQIDVGAPRPSAADASFSPATVQVGGSSTLTLTFDNTDGTATAEDVKLLLTPFPAGLTVTGVTVDGVPTTVSAIGTGSGIGDVPVGEVRVVRATVVGTTAGSLTYYPYWAYGYTMCAGDSTPTGGSLTNVVTLDVTPPPTTGAPSGPGAGAGPTGPGAVPKDTTAPDTKIKKHPKKRTAKRKARLTFRSTEAGSTFVCKIDRKKAKPCTPPKRYKKLRPGRHVFRVWAVDAAGNKDPRPAVYRWRVIRPGR